MGQPHAAPYTGVTDIDAYGSFGGEAGSNIQVGKYIRFRALYGMTFDAAHFITNASAGVDSNHDGRVDSRAIRKTANPTYRESIDIPGRRFRVEDSRDWHLFVPGLADVLASRPSRLSPPRIRSERSGCRSRAGSGR